MTPRSRALVLLAATALLVAALVGILEHGRASTTHYRAPMAECIRLGWCDPTHLDRYPGHDTGPDPLDRHLDPIRDRNR